MGITKDGVVFLSLAKIAGADFTSTLMLGHQKMFADAKGLSAALEETGLVADDAAVSQMSRPHTTSSRSLLRHFGAEVVSILDYSDFEGADRLHDLNEPIPSDWHMTYDVVLDGGTTEHVFNVPMALQNTMNLVRVGGHLISIVPCNQLMGHGFYQFSPELFHRVLCPDNGFDIKLALLRETGLVNRWFLAEDPKEVGRRQQSMTVGQSHLFVLAQRTNSTTLDAPTVQSDYESAWEHSDAPRTGHSQSARAAALKRRASTLLGRSGQARLAALLSIGRSAAGRDRRKVDVRDMARELATGSARTTPSNR